MNNIPKQNQDKRLWFCVKKLRIWGHQVGFLGICEFVQSDLKIVSVRCDGMKYSYFWDNQVDK